MYIEREIFLKQENTIVRIQTTQYSNLLGFRFTIADYDVPADAVALMYIQKPSGLEVFGAGTVDGNTITFPLTNQMTAEAGVSVGQVKITSDNKVQNSFIFKLEVQECIIDDEAIQSSDEFGALDTLINTTQAALAAVEAATQAALDAASQAREPVRVGAYNLLINTSIDGADVYLEGASASSGSVTATNSNRTLTWASLPSSWTHYFAPSASGSMYCFEAGKSYYISGKIKASSSGTVAIISNSGSDSTIKSISVTTSDQEFREMFTIGSSVTRFTVGLKSTNLSGKSVTVTDIQIEEATVPSVYRPAFADIATNLQSAVTSLTALIEVINGGATTAGYINTYNSSSHKAGISFNTYSSVTVPSVIIDGNTFRLLRNLTQINAGQSNGTILNMELTTGATWKLAIHFYVDGQTYTKYINLSNS